MTAYRAPSFKLRKSATAVLSANGEKLVQLTQRTIVFDVRTRKVCCEFKVMKNEWHVAISHDGSRIAVKGENGEIAFCSGESGAVLAETKRTGMRETGCQPLFSKDGNLLIDGCWDGSIRLWDTATATEVGRIERPGYMVTQLVRADDVNRYFALFSRIGDGVEYRVVSFTGENLRSLEEIAPPDKRAASGRGWAQIEKIAVDPAAERLILALVGRDICERNCVLSLSPNRQRYVIGELPSRMHFVQGLACASDGLVVAAVRENLTRKGQGFRRLFEAQRITEHSHLHFFDADSMLELCSWHWQDAWMVGFAEQAAALFVASRDEPGGYLANYAFKRTAGEILRSSERFRPAAA